MQTRGATRRAANASLPIQQNTVQRIDSAFKTTKRSAEASPQEQKPHDEPPSKRMRGIPVPKKSQPADELPHGLGRIHAPKTETTAGPVDTTEPVVSSPSLAVFSTNEKKEDIKEDKSGGPLLPTTAETALLSAPGTTTTQVLQAHLYKPETSEVTTGPTHSGDVEIAGASRTSSSGDKPGVDGKQKRTPRRSKDNPYGLMPGQTPFPDWLAPSIEDCKKVHEILTEMHGEFKPPEKIPAPSTSVAGCGEVPDIVDALIRTLISGHTSMQNANLAIQDVIEKYGQWNADSIGAGSIEWNKVRLSEEHDVVDTIKRAGLGPTKGKDIKIILDMVYEDNQQRLAAYNKERETGEMAGIQGAQELTQGQKDHQASKIQSGILTLDHIRGLTPDEAMLEFTKFPGIGVKTSSCLILFCLQQPSFAVDTHVWRFCKWLKWVPPKASRDDTYMHGEVRIPNYLKYGLHQLFIRHGKECRRCRSVTVEGTSDWDSAECPLEDLLDRFDKRKTKAQPKKKKAAVDPSGDNDEVEEDQDEEQLQQAETEESTILQ